MGTPHNSASKGDIAKTVLMPGDPLRAKFIAEHFLEDAVCFNRVRNMFGYTGTYKGKEVSVMGSGMGMPSMGIYSYELFSEYDVDRIIRIGSAGGYADDVHVRDVIIAMAASMKASTDWVEHSHRLQTMECSVRQWRLHNRRIFRLRSAMCFLQMCSIMLTVSMPQDGRIWVCLQQRWNARHSI